MCCWVASFDTETLGEFSVWGWQLWNVKESMHVWLFLFLGICISIVYLLMYHLLYHLYRCIYPSIIYLLFYHSSLHHLPINYLLCIYLRIYHLSLSPLYIYWPFIFISFTHPLIIFHLSLSSVYEPVIYHLSLVHHSTYTDFSSQISIAYKNLNVAVEWMIKATIGVRLIQECTEAKEKGLKGHLAKHHHPGVIRQDKDRRDSIVFCESTNHCGKYKWWLSTHA